MGRGAAAAGEGVADEEISTIETMETGIARALMYEIRIMRGKNAAGGALAVQEVGVGTPPPRDSS